MKELTFEKMEEVQGGLISEMCKSIAAGSLVYAVGVEACWWNPIGWVSGTLMAMDGACLIYAWAN